MAERERAAVLTTGPGKPEQGALNDAHPLPDARGSGSETIGRGANYNAAAVSSS